MKFSTASALASVAPLAVAVKTERTFAVLRFNGDGFLTEGPMDPVVNPGAAATHYHSIMGGSNFGISTQGNDLLDSSCTTAKIKNDKSAYWIPTLFFQDPANPESFEKVPLFYMNVYYFFEPTNSTIEAFPAGLKMLSGDTKTRSPPSFGGGSNLDPSQGDIQPVQWTCPRSSYSPASYPADSDGTMAGMQDPHNEQAGAGFPLYNCDGYGSPLRQDIHFPSCYNPEVGIDDYKNNMAWPTTVDGLQTCPSGWIQTPHIFYEVYWNTPDFKDRWTPDGKTQPFVLSNGDATGYASHGDFIAGWDTETLQTIIDTCDAGSSGMDQCPDIPGGLNTVTDCTIAPAIGTMVKLSEVLKALPLDNPVTGWGKGNSSSGSSDSSSSASQAESTSYTASTLATQTSAAASATGNAFVEVSNNKEAASSPVVTAAAAAVTSVAADANVATVIDTVYVTSTVTIDPEATAQPARRRRAPAHNHAHAQRHIHGGRR